MNIDRYINMDKEHDLINLLLYGGVINQDQLNNALCYQKQTGSSIDNVLVDLNLITITTLVDLLSKIYEVPALDLSTLTIPLQSLKLLSLEMMGKYNAIPLEFNDLNVSLAMSNPSDLNIIKEIEFALCRKIKPFAVPSRQITAVLRFLLNKGGHADQPLRVRDICDLDTTYTSVGAFPTHQDLCQALVERGGSDLLMSTGAPASLKINGELIRLPYPVLTGHQMTKYTREIMTTSQWQEFESARELDFSIAVQSVGRFRVNAYIQRGSIALSIRATTNIIPSFETLGLPNWLEEYALRPNGMIIISAPTGHGKTTTLAALINIINTSKKSNIVTIEDPIEYHHKHKLSNVNQREVGVDTLSFYEGLKRVFRQAPDVIVIGEIRDPDSAAIAVQAANSGHLVISTVHATNSTSAVERLIDLFSPIHQNQIRVQLAESLLLVLDQRLVTAKNGNGRILVYEKLINSARISSIIRENKTHQIRNLFKHGSDDFKCLDIMLSSLYSEGKISKDSALLHCESSNYILEKISRASI